MKFNAFQKSIFVTLLLFLIISSIFFIPYREYGSSDVAYKSITFVDGKIDFIRFIIQIFLLVLIAGLLLALSSTINTINWEAPSTKKTVKRELKYLGLFTLASVVLCSTFYLLNFYQTKKVQQLENSISLIDHSRNNLIDSLHYNDEAKNVFAKDILGIIKYSKDLQAKSLNEEIINSDTKGTIEDQEVNKAEIDIFSDLKVPNSYFNNIVKISSDPDHIKLLLKIILNSDLKTEETSQNTKSLYNELKKDGLYTKSYPEFISQFSSNGEIKKLYDLLLDKGKYDKAFINFSLQFFYESYYNKKLVFYKKLAGNPELFKNKINSLNKYLPNSHYQLKQMDADVIRYQVNKNSKWVYNSDQINKILIIIVISLFVLLFILRYTVYLTSSVIKYLR